jgi:hypothetical protein
MSCIALNIDPLKYDTLRKNLNINYEFCKLISKKAGCRTDIVIYDTGVKNLKRRYYTTKYGGTCSSESYAVEYDSTKNTLKITSIASATCR